MSRKLSPEHRLELDALYRIVSTIAEWYGGLVDVPTVPRMAATISAAFEAHDLRGMRMAQNDLVEMTHAATIAQRRDLDGRLRKQANTSLEALDTRRVARIQKIRTRGKVTSEEQYYLLREYVDLIASAPNQANEVRDLLGLLEAYEKRAIRH